MYTRTINRFGWCTLYLAANVCLLSAHATSSNIDIKTLPPDPDSKESSAVSAIAAESEPTRRSAIAPDWAGDHSAVLDGDQARVILSWSVQGEYLNFQVKKIAAFFKIFVQNAPMASVLFKIIYEY
jgi:hypothetical protein